MTQGEEVWPDRAHAALRIVAGALFLLHGVYKLWGLPGAGGDTVALASLIGVAAVIELVTGALLLAGAWTRMAAIIASGEMAFAYWTSHAPANPLPVLNGGDAAILYCFIFLYLAASGPGAFSIDRWLRSLDRPTVIRERIGPFV